jgi:hypothetical protein
MRLGYLEKEEPQILVRDPTCRRDFLAVIEGKSSFAYGQLCACLWPG